MDGNPNLPRCGSLLLCCCYAACGAKNPYPEYAQKFDMHINSTRHFFQNHFNEIPKLHSKATIPPVVM